MPIAHLNAGSPLAARNHDPGAKGRTHPAFDLKPWHRSDPESRRVFAGSRAQLFNLTIFDPVSNFPLSWARLVPSQQRKIHIAMASADLSTLIHVHPEDFKAWADNYEADTETFTIEVVGVPRPARLSASRVTCPFQLKKPLNRAGKWAVLVEFDTMAADEDGNSAGHDSGHGVHKRHGQKTVIGTSVFEAVADPSPADSGEPAWPTLEPSLPVPKPSGVAKFRGIMLMPPPEDEAYTLPMIAPDLSLDDPQTPRTTVLVNQTFLATLRTVPATLKTNECATGILEFFMSSNGTWAPVTNLNPFLAASSHLTTVHESLLELGHAHSVVYEEPDVQELAPAAPWNVSALPDICSKPMHHSPDPVFGSKLLFPLFFKKSGKYAIFAQSSRLQDGEFVHSVGGIGRVMLAPRFVVQVGKGGESTTGLKPKNKLISRPGKIPEPGISVDGMQGAELGGHGSSTMKPGNMTAIAVVILVAFAAMGIFFYWRRKKEAPSHGFIRVGRSLSHPNLLEGADGYDELVEDFDGFFDDGEEAGLTGNKAGNGRDVGMTDLDNGKK